MLVALATRLASLCDAHSVRIAGCRVGILVRVQSEEVHLHQLVGHRSVVRSDR